MQTRKAGIGSHLISDKRKEQLEAISAAIQLRIQENGVADILIICTHNSRRSQLAQFWINTLAQKHGLSIRAWSGGTEATAFNHRMVAALRDSGFGLEKMAEKDNPTFCTGSHEHGHLRYFSKVYDHPPNPERDFIAILVCSSAHETCPIVKGADVRFYLPYLDPKRFDDTAEEAEEYLKTVAEIGSEMEYILALRL